MKQTKKFYVTTPIYYATAAPHLGTLYSTVLADALARWHKLLGDKVYFLTGTDEFGQKVAQSAADAGKDPQTFVDGFIQDYKNLWQSYEIDYSQFMRTTNAYHIEAVQFWLKKLMNDGFIYKGAYEGWYCMPCETYLTDKDSLGKGEQPPCISCNRATKKVSEPTYFFKLSAFQDKLLAFYQKNPDFIIPQERYAEVISFVKSGLQDISISRTTLKWGVPFPGDDAHVTYVWADALNNYITAIGYAQAGREQEFHTWWPADIQVMGKDIVRFHAIYWPAFLMAAQLPMPHHLLVHGWIKIGENKMSKSLGNAVDPKELLDKYGADAVRYYLLRQLAVTQDGQFSIEDLEQKITSDLANDLGNLLNRTSMLAHKYEKTTITPAVWGKQELELHAQAIALIDEVAREMERGYFHRALAATWKYVGNLNSYFHACEPWKLAKQDPAAFERVLSATCHGLYTVAVLTWPIMPQKMEALCAALGCTFELKSDMVSQLRNEPWNKVFTVHITNPLFCKPEIVEKQSQEPVVSENSQLLPQGEEITIEEFAKVQLRVGTIEACTAVAKSEKLLRLEVDFGLQGKRVIFSGIQKWYTPEKLIGRQAVFVVNLKPRKMMGELSHGMFLVVADGNEERCLLAPERLVPNGSLLT